MRVLEIISTSMQKYGLALHTTSPQLGLALDNFAGNQRSQIWDLGHELGNYLHLKLLEVMDPQDWQDLGFLAVAIGPGSFTGTRLGVVTARTLAQQLDLPLVGVSSFAAFACWWVYEHTVEYGQIIALSSPAQRGQLFVGIYQVTKDAQNPLKTILKDTVMTPTAWQEKLTELSSSLNFSIISLEVPTNLGMTVTSLLDLARSYNPQNLDPQVINSQDTYKRDKNDNKFLWSAVLPFYGQHPVDS